MYIVINDLRNVRDAPLSKLEFTPGLCVCAPSIT